MIALAVLPIIVLAYLLWRADRRMDLMLKEWSLERTALLQRIQAPELAAIPEFEPVKSHVDFDDDEDYWKAKAEEWQS